MNENLNFLGKDFQDAIQVAVESESLDIEIKKLEEKEKQLQKTRKPLYFDFSKHNY